MDAMRINERILEIADESGIARDSAMGVLLPLHHGYRPVFVPRKTHEKLMEAGIFSEDRDMIVTWHVPLFEGQTEDAFEWVRGEYMDLFRRASPSKAVYATEALRRMKRMFAENPDVRKGEVLGATEMYLSRTDPTYVMWPNYFIRKGAGVNLQEPILHWVGEYRRERDRGIAPKSARRALL